MPSGEADDPREVHRQRIYQSATHSHEGRRLLLSVALAFVVFLLVLALSARQVTDRRRAEQIIASGVAATTDVDRVVAEDQPLLAQVEQSSPAGGFAIPGYPLKVYVSRDEVKLAPTQLRDVILSRSATVVYEQGLSAFDRTGNQSFSRFSTQGLIDFAGGQISDTTYTRASLAAILLSVLAALLSGAVLAAYRGWSRLRVLGIAVLAGSAPVVFLFGVAWFAAGRVGGSDPFVADLRVLARNVLSVPLRDGTIVSLAAIRLVVIGVASGYAERRFGARAEFEPDFDPAPVPDD